MKIKTTVLDRLFSEFIRKRAVLLTGGCEYCGAEKHDKPKNDGTYLPAWKQLQCSHYISRRNKSTRFDIDNCVGLCFSCHQYLDSNPYIHTEWVKKKLGSNKLELLVIRGNKSIKPDLDKLKLEIKGMIKLLEVG